MSPSKPVADDVEEVVPGNKLTLEYLVGVFWLFKTAFEFFYDMDHSITQALKWMQTVEELVLYRNIFREMKKQKSQTEIRI